MNRRRLLAVIALTAVLAACEGGGDQPDDSASADSTASWDWADSDHQDGTGPDGSTVPEPEGTPADPDIYTDSYAGHAFATPTGNIVCFIDSEQDSWGCIIKQRTYTEPPGDEQCFTEFGNGFSSVQGGTPQVLCRGGVIAEAESGEGPILPYGSTLTVGSVTCLSEKNGVTCVDQRSGHSLFISKARYEIT
ncbi:MAG: hypothetical protein QM597_01040 [Aeromicrobium sp.]|uniref:DUF6636 domain-containing protein n=1 Tax=Aeromicrobium sp. TaxID=1871063 RepID=UPI0039E4D02B